MIIVGISVAGVVETLLHGVDGLGPALEHLLDVAAVLHGDAAHVVLLVDPHQEGLVLVVEDASGIGPVAGSTAVGQHIVGSGLLEQETLALEQVLLRLGHATQRVVLASKVSRHTGQSIAQEALHGAALLAVSGGGKGQGVDGTTGADAGGHNVLVELLGLLRGHLQVGEVHVRLVGIGGLVSVPALDDDVHDVLVHLVGSSLASGNANTKVRSIQTGLDGLIKGETHRSLHVGVLGVKRRVVLKGLAGQRSVLVGDQREVADRVHRSRAGGDTKILLDGIHATQNALESFGGGFGGVTGLGVEGLQ